MEFSTGAWWIVAGAASIGIGIISYFLRRTIAKTDDHEKDISEIKRTYVTKDELNNVREEIKSDLKQLTKDVSEIKDKTLTKADFYRATSRTEDKIDKLTDLWIKNGGNQDGR